MCAAAPMAVKAREAAAMIATGRWAYRSALARPRAAACTAERPARERRRSIASVSGLDSVSSPVAADA